MREAYRPLCSKSWFGGEGVPTLAGRYLPWGTPILTWLGVPTLGDPLSWPCWVVPTLAEGYLPWGNPILTWPEGTYLGQGYLPWVPPILTRLGGTYLGRGVLTLEYPSPILTWLGRYLPCEQTPVKTVPSQRSTYVGGKKDNMSNNKDNNQISLGHEHRHGVVDWDRNYWHYTKYNI